MHGREGGATNELADHAIIEVRISHRVVISITIMDVPANGCILARG